jgi:ubiquinone biosynthesis protein
VPEQVTTAASNNGFEVYQERRPAGLVRRSFITLGQLLALLFGGINAYVRQQAASGAPLTLWVLLLSAVLLFVRPFIDRRLIQLPFPVQFRLRLERLGPTYIKLGQILSLREDLLPKPITDELKNLLDRLPVVTFERFKELIEADLRRPVDTIFRWIDPKPLGSASLAQTQRARLLTGERVVLKVLKPGVRQTVQTDTRLLRLVGAVLQIFLGRYQPARLIAEFSRYTLREVDLRFEADNAETFAADFKDQPDVHFPKIYREFSNRDVLCMAYFQGIKPDAQAARILTRQQKDRVIQLGIHAILQMIFDDGFFHADLHPGNMIVFRDGSVGFIDLGMVGVFDREIRKRLFYFFYSMVTGDPENAARYLVSLTTPTRNSDAEGFQRAAAGLYARWLRSSSFSGMSAGRVILQSILLAGQYRITYPGEMILMIKALLTVEGVANTLEPGFDILKASRGHVQALLLQQFNPLTTLRTSLLVVPELIDVMNRSPLVLTEGLKHFESNLKKSPDNSVERLQTTVLVGFGILAAAVLFAASAPWPWYAGLGLVLLIALIRR